MTSAKSNKIQLLRGLAIIAVVFIHNTPDGLAQVFCRPFLNFAVGLFLFLSGMLSNVNHWNPRKRIIKVAVPYVLWTFIYTALYNIATPSALPALFVKKLMTGGAAAIMYYIFVYCEFTLLIPLIDRLARSKYKYFGLLISPIEMICMRLIPLVLGYELNTYIKVILRLSCLSWFTFFYLGYLLGNHIIQIKIPTKRLVGLWAMAIVLQMAEGYWYLSMGEANCGTQTKLSCILTGVPFVIMAYRFVSSEKEYHLKFLKRLGDCSFGIYFSHLAVMAILEKIPYYSQYVFYPLNGVIAVLVSFAFVLAGGKILGKFGKYLAL
nr:acyltransferase [uncultured Solibaculum sp.]